MNSPLVSILTPVYNVEQFLPECLNSIVGQTYQNLQIVLIDDGSTDGSYLILQEYSSRDTRIEVYTQHNCRVAETRNRLLSKVKGDYILFVDSDDWLELNAIELLMSEMQKGDYDMLSFQQVETPSQDFVYTQEEAIKHFLEHTTFRGALWSKFMRSSHLQGLKFEKGISYGEDALMVWQVLQRVKNVRILPNKLYNYRENPTGISLSSFDERKFSAYFVWKRISEETRRWWPQYEDIVRARYAVESTVLLLHAADSKYSNRQNIRKLQQVAKLYGPLIAKTHISSRKMSALSWISSRSYAVTRIISKILSLVSR